MKKYLFIFCLFFQTVFAGFIIEPYVGYGLSTSGEVENQPLLLDYQGVYAGGRLGYFYESMMGGLLLDFMWFDLKASSTVAPYSYTYPTDQSNFGVFLGANLENGIKFWGEYLLYVKNDYFSGVYGENYDKGDGWGLGFGYAVVPNLAFNIQFRYLTLDEVPAYSWSNKVLTQEILFTVSFPVYPF